MSEKYTTFDGVGYSLLDDKEVVGKTITAVHGIGDSTLVLVLESPSDNREFFAVTNEGYDGDTSLEPDMSSLSKEDCVFFGLSSQAKLDELLGAERQRRESATEADQRRIYEKLRAKFELPIDKSHTKG